MHRGRSLSGRWLAAAIVAVAIALPGLALADDVNWATRRAEERTIDGELQLQGGHVEAAIQSFRQAIDIDPTFGQAYVDLGRLRMREGDVDEAERTLSAGIEHVLGFYAGYVARGELRLSEGRKDEAIADLEMAISIAPNEPAVFSKLCEMAISAGKLPYALGVARNLLTLALRTGDAESAKKAELTVVALSQLIQSIDPVLAGREGSPVRRALARAAASGSLSGGSLSGGSGTEAKRAPAKPKPAPAPAATPAPPAASAVPRSI